MKTKRINRLTSLVLAIVMLASVVTLPVFAVEETETEPKVFANVDFEDAEVNQEEVPPPEGSPEGTPPTYKEGTSITASGIASAHTYVSIGEDEEHGKYAIIPFRGLTEDGKTGSGNFDNVFTIQHAEISYAEYQGVSFEFDIKPDFVAIEGASDPTVEFQLRSINHAPDSEGKTSSSWISFATINLRTGAVSTSAAKIDDAKTLKVGEWNKLRFDLDLSNGRFEIVLNGEKFAVYGTIGKSNSPKEIVIPAGNLLIAKCNKNKGAYADLNGEGNPIPDAEMSRVSIDNIKLYVNPDFVPPAPEEVIPYSIFNDSLQGKPLGMSPKLAGYKYAPNTAVITTDPTDESNQVVKVEIKGNGEGEYYLMSSTKQGSEKIKPNADYNPDDAENFPEYTIVDGIMTANTDMGGKITAPIWGDDPDEQTGGPGAEYVIASMANVKDKQGNACNWYLVTGRYCDAIHGAGNVATALGVMHPELKSENYDTIVLNVDYYFSEDALGKMEIQMNAKLALNSDPNVLSSNIWVDVAVIEAKADNDILSFADTSNYVKVCGAPPIVRKGEWFTLSAVINMTTGYEDIYVNGSYAFTQKPRASYKIGSNDVSEGNFHFHSIVKDTLSVGKIQRGGYPETLDGFYMIDNVNFSTGEVLLGETYEKTYIENFDKYEIGTTDFSDSTFALEIPASVVLAGDDTHATALKMTVGEPLDPETAEAPVLFRSGNNADETFYRVAKVYDDKSVLLARDLAEGEEAPEVAPDAAIQPKRSLYTVDGVGGFKLGTYGAYVNYWGKLEDGTASGNVDKSWIFHNPGISYALKERVATDVELFLPEEASGLLSSQIKMGAGTKDGTKANFNFLDLYVIDMATGNVNIGNTVSDTKFMGTLNKGAWNTVSLAINMVTGIAELYVNNQYVGEADLGYTELAFYENTWILAKVARKQEPSKNPLAGYVMIDDARFFTVTNQMITVNAAMENVIEVNFAGKVIEEGTKLFITEDVRCTCEDIDENHACGKYYEKRFDTEAYLEVISGDDYYAYSWDCYVAVRSTRPIGLRFTSYVDEEILAELLAQYEGDVTYGTVILPTSAVATVDEITRPELNLRGIEYLDVRTDSFFSNQYLEEEQDYDFTGIFAGSIVGLSEANIKRDFTAVGYVEIALATGGSIVIYTDAMQANLAALAQQYLDESDEIPADIKTVLEAFAIGRYPQGYDDGLRNDVK